MLIERRLQKRADSVAPPGLKFQTPDLKESPGNVLGEPCSITD